LENDFSSLTNIYHILGVNNNPILGGKTVQGQFLKQKSQ